MAHVISLKLKDDIFSETESTLKGLEKSRNAYINEAIDFYNRIMRRKRIKAQLINESRLTRSSSLETLQVFEALEDEIIE